MDSYGKIEENQENNLNFFKDSKFCQKREKIYFNKSRDFTLDFLLDSKTIFIDYLLFLVHQNLVAVGSIHSLNVYSRKASSGQRTVD